ncbi:hypothetical protein L1077_13665 [Pseudoalteromonas luteoviolacea]|uniref:hypothetical protein n=1 Tax=Pseudoalteromonas luteoviolacea TaxID=43657 RepID=UPI001F1D90D3|nr:hypothetical protein [Pseudoalteromonas luteoviolacea]MCF6440479.1 hypothetical protein [Pseudoalteromonas luteoviolacea]
MFTLIKLIPYECFRVKCDYSFRDLSERIDSKLGQPKLFKGLDGRLMCGERYGTEFKAYQLLSYQNGFQPIAFGKMNEGQAGCEIEITIRMHKATMLFFIVWTLILVQSCISHFSTPMNEWGWISVIPLILLFATYIVMYVSFWSHVDDLKYLLKQLYSET